MGALLRFVQNDGGRQAAGFKGKTGDCVCRAIAIVTGKPYREVYDALNQAAKRERPRKGGRKRSSARTGVNKATIRRYLEALGFEWMATMSIGSGCRVHLRADELPSGRLIVSVSRHIVAVIDGVVHDTHDPGRDGTRCVYGYWTAPPGASATGGTAMGDESTPPRDKPVRDWLRKHNARSMWAQPVRNVGTVELFSIGQGAVIVLTYQHRAGWELFVPASDNPAVDLTLAAAERALEL